MADLITERLVHLDVDLGADKETVIRSLAQRLGEAGRASSPDQVATDALAREATSPTGLPGGIAIPHCRTSGVSEPTLAFARLSPGVGFGAKDGPADLVFLITAPTGGEDTHLQLLAKLARSLVKKDFTDALRAARTEQEVLDLVDTALGQSRSAAAAAPAAPAAPAAAAAPAAPASSAPAADSALITADLVALDAGLGYDKEAVIRALAARVGAAGRATDAEQVATDALTRESTSATGLPGGIAIPHARTSGVEQPTLAFARLSPKVDFGAKDGPADLVFLITAPAGGDDAHLQILAKLAQSLVKKEFTDGLRAARTPEEVVERVGAAITGDTGSISANAASSASEAGGTAASGASAAAPAASTASTATAVQDGPRRLVAVTACPTGIAHTYMAAEALQDAAARAGVDIQVETQGSAGSKPLSPETIAAADAVIFAVDVGVRDRARFAGKPVVSSGVKRPIDEGDAMIAEALRFATDPGAPRVEGDAAAAGSGAGGGGAGESWGGRIRRVLMTGVSYMIPFVAAGGLLIALGFLLAGYEVALSTYDATGVARDSSIFNLPDAQALGLDHALFGSDLMAYLGTLLFVLGGAAFSFLVPALAGYIAFAIADRPGIAPGFVMGAVAGTTQSGFIGGIVGGVLAGVIAHWITTWRVPAALRGLMPVLVIPLLTTLLAGLVMVVVLGKPLAALMTALSDGLNSLSGGSAILLGVILGLMMAFDMGGPLNKTAYAFATTGLAAAATSTDAPQLKVMAAVMLAGMVPPLGLALATVVRPKLFNIPERENGKAGWFLGASFITEGAIPFAAADPLRVIPAIMLGSAVTGGLSEAFGVGLRAPHGGIFVLFAVENIPGFLIALVAGTLVAAAAVIGLKSLGGRTPAPTA